ncbi:CRISPR-associated protein Cas4 [Alicyclobacillus acidoterrestris]|uniref:CRISPR-associated protein Cas4 n=1 Tax=Alicyclobacillus acidoterrestris TaxID=1450 RepID=UPI003F539202
MSVNHGQSVDDVEPVQLSALQHYSYCPRQCALIHVEQVFDENVFTMKGRWAHTQVDEEHVQSSGGHQILTALPVWSDEFGLVGKCDVVELHGDVPYPVEFKHGPRQSHIWDEVQLCAQAMCLEEMFHVPVREGAIYHISSRRRRSVEMTQALRDTVVQIANEVRSLRELGSLPPAVNDERCAHCSLNQACMPTYTNGLHRETWEDVLWKMEGRG